LVLAAEAIADASVREQFIDDILKESQKTVLGHEKEIKEPTDACGSLVK
jgi:arginine deiminase